MTVKRRRAPEPAAETLPLVLLSDVEDLGARGAIVEVDIDRAADLETASSARRATDLDLSIAGKRPAKPS
jgi:hypothetical protein